jgi:hypothetical protein
MRKPKRWTPKQFGPAELEELAVKIQDDIRDIYYAAVSEGCDEGCVIAVLRMSDEDDRRAYRTITGKRDNNPNHVHLMPLDWMGGARECFPPYARRALDACPGDMIRVALFHNKGTIALFLPRRGKMTSVATADCKLNDDGSTTMVVQD